MFYDGFISLGFFNVRRPSLLAQYVTSLLQLRLVLVVIRRWAPVGWASGSWSHRNSTRVGIVAGLVFLRFLSPF